MTQLENGWTELARKLEEVTAELDRERALNDKLVESYEKADSELRKLKKFDAEQYMIGVETGKNEYRERLIAAEDELDKLKAEREQIEKAEPVGIVRMSAPPDGTPKPIPKWIMTADLSSLKDGDKLYAHPPVPDGKVLVDASLLTYGDVCRFWLDIKEVRRTNESALQAAQKGEQK